VLAGPRGEKEKTPAGDVWLGSIHAPTWSTDQSCPAPFGVIEHRAATEERGRYAELTLLLQGVYRGPLHGNPRL
jgi:hypothetical protein